VTVLQVPTQPAVADGADAARRPDVRGDAGGLVLRALRLTGVAALTGVAIGVAWVAFLRVFHVDPLLGKTPLDVWHFIVSSADAPANRSAVFADLFQTLRDAGLGFLLGLVSASGVALAFVMFRSLEQSLMPIAMILRSVPLVAMTPLIALVFGRGLTGVSVICGIVVFFPALVTIVYGLRSAPQQTSDVIRAYGGTPWTVLRKVAVPSASAAFFTAARISVPGALIGGLIAEWLSTGQGLGYRMLGDVQSFSYDDLWASVVVLTLTSLVLYAAVGMLESLVLARMNPAARR
jgi:ABC-type nitrate/sulfonate/bicarbonate transport system permease component